jgi:sulfur carrier protein
MKVVMRHPTREVTVDGAATVRQLLDRLDILPESVLVIRSNELLTRSDHLHPDDTIELRPVISGGA